jgi:4-diphosphocytidyl-2-C-methyl-D-erythritol kinase
VLPARPRRTPLDGGALRLAAPAKLNLDLRVGPRRDDGYHPLDSLVAKVTLYDDVVLRPRKDGRIAFRCEGADCGPDENNLALRAARLLAGEAAATGGADILLAKSIPPGRGLGGGSSDAAAVLEGLNELWGLALATRELSQFAADLGSDVPLFLGPRASRMTGRGEVLQPVALCCFVALLHMPELTASSAEVYARFDRLPGADRPIPRRTALPPETLPPSRWRNELRNDLTPAAVALNDDLARTMATLTDVLDTNVSMTGSGSALFVLCDDADEAAELLARLPADLPGRTVLVRDNPW